MTLSRLFFAGQATIYCIDVDDVVCRQTPIPEMADVDEQRIPTIKPHFGEFKGDAQILVIVFSGWIAINGDGVDAVVSGTCLKPLFVHNEQITSGINASNQGVTSWVGGLFYRIRKGNKMINGRYINRAFIGDP